MKQIAQGAEAKIFLDHGMIIKNRFKKSYRLKEIDVALRKFRTRRESKVLEKLPLEVKGPKLLKMDDKEMNIEMEFINGPKVRDILDDKLELGKEIGKKIAILHNAEIIHGDLTTSNMIFHNNKVYFIDFGLSFFSHKVEDKAVDLHLLKQALESKHYKVYEKAFKLVLQGYKEKSNDYEGIIQRFEKVEGRGRYKGKH
ncbi:Kae1-associated serine/threonine protein kinase [Candidatus Woesearchaeota archaeon]|nr:Kae1-associated serine/threonine protein kinase [Candidatus Woesearchaeota archaeon]